MENIVNVAVQVLPSAKDIHPYTLVDAGIEAIQNSGLTYEVCPFETVIEGPYDEVMALVKQVQQACYAAGAEQIITNIKIQTRRSADVSIEDKIGKYRK
ncbi:thiamine-binding protein [Persicobacter psychrovividus]|uniref:Thiamine-binding protein domain-containing protein n=1 Tax=Persicobacter psychrovividus TaxID=387638 RepID=A0ABM7VJ91_9BACT|nr:hypothetical protein PEPS_33320 [Persicobacter psychrovividus]